MLMPKRYMFFIFVFCCAVWDHVGMTALHSLTTVILFHVITFLHSYKPKGKGLVNLIYGLDV